MRRTRLSVMLIVFFSLTTFVSACGQSGQASRQASQTTPTATLTPTPNTTAQYAAQMQEAMRTMKPDRLVIPKMKLDAHIIAVDPDANGAMPAPRDPNPQNAVWSEVYWWDVGALPGQTGNAVIAGHVNRPDASPSTFTNLNALTPGDTFSVVAANGQSLTFVVRDKVSETAYTQNVNDPTLQRIFGPAQTPNLNLITCWGDWDGKQFDHRLVVYSELVGPSPFPAQS